jgi:hypothetical protein
MRVSDTDRQLKYYIEEWVTYAAKISARSAYCQYSRFGIGSSSDAGRDSRLGFSLNLEENEEGSLQISNVLDRGEPISLAHHQDIGMH